jgi:NAD(P)-dependent dehydrogenase (short-subunit alcohol dehydrogenase family)
MASAWITRRATSDGAPRYRVEYRVGGRESKTCYAGSFRTMREARGRRDYVVGELAALRVPGLQLDISDPAETLRQAAERWKASRVDVAVGTLVTYTVALGRLLPRLGDTSIEAIDAQMVADLVGELHAAGLKKATIRKTIVCSGWFSTMRAAQRITRCATA